MKFPVLLILILYFVTADIDFDANELFPNLFEDEYDYDLPVEIIVNGQQAERKQFPYQALLQILINIKSTWCGGTLISDQWVLTAAHCTEEATSITVIMGAHNRKADNEKKRQEFSIDKKDIIIHKDWDNKTWVNDISLLKLPNDAKFDDFVKPAKLPWKESSSFAKKWALTSGWGRLGDGKPQPQILQWIKIPILENDKCKETYGDTVKDMHICIDTQSGASTCNGDSGGPLVLENSDYLLIGVTSFAIKLGCEYRYPVVFARVTFFMDWIEEQTGIKQP